MKILVTGAKGFVGKNLCTALQNVKDLKDKTRNIDTDITVFQCDIDTDSAVFENYCSQADFVFNLAGVNRVAGEETFAEGNENFTQKLLDTLKKQKNICPVMYASSIQATLEGRYEGSQYGKSKRNTENIVFNYGEETGAPVYVFRFPNIFGKWCKPHYNSVVATFCHCFANDFPYHLSNRENQLTLLYIDNLIDEMFNVLKGKVNRCEYDGLNITEKEDGRFCYCAQTHNVTLGEIIDLLESFKNQPSTLVLPNMPKDSFEKKLYATYVSYLPKEKVAFPLRMNVDERGSFTELFKTLDCGQVSVNISKPGVTKGQHWHNTKWEFFVVVSGKGLIQQRKIGTDEVLEFYVSGEDIQAVHMLPGYTHNIINLSETKNLVTVMWANESFDPNNPDTFFEIVE